MNQREWKRLCKVDKHLLNWDYYNKTRKLQKSLQFNTNENATVIHHLRDTEEQREYNDTYYEYWGFNQDGTFEYGKYVIFLTKEEHNKIHSDSEETRKKKKDASVNYWSDPINREYHSLISKLWWDEEKRSKLSICYTGEGNPFYGKHHSEETLEKLSGKNSGMYGKHHTEETRKKMSDSRMGHIVTEETRAKISVSNTGHKVSDETKEKISIANTGKQRSEEFKLYLSEKYTGKGNPFYGRHHTDETRSKLSGEKNGMYGKHHTAEAKRLISEANKCKTVSQETRDKLSKAASGENNGMYGKKHTEEALEKLKHSRGVILQQQASIAYKEHKENGGTMKWQDFRREFFKLNK